MCADTRRRGTVLLTRPAGYNDSLSNRLEAASYDVIEKPLLEIVPVPLPQDDKQAVMDLDLYDDIIFVSGNAVDFGIDWLRQYWPQWPAALRWFAVGPATAERLQACAEVEPVFPEHGASDALLRKAELQSVADRRILIVRGVGGREQLADTLRGRGADVRYLEVYQRSPVDYGPELALELERARLICVVVTSGEALVQLARLVEAEGFGVTILVPSERVRNIAIELGFAKVGVVEAMTDEAVAQAITEID